MDETTTTIALSEVFTPPSSCSSSWWTYEPSDYNNVASGLIIQNALVNIETECFPRSWGNFGRAQATQLYSPGWCPEGSTTAAQAQNDGTTTATCCLSGHSYFTTLTVGGGTDTVIFAGCLSTWSRGSSTSILQRGSGDALDSTVVSGPVIMWAQPLTVAFQDRDTHLFTSSGPTTSPTTTPTPAAGAGTTSPTRTPTSTPTREPSPTSTPDSGLSTGAQAGIGVGVALGVIALLAALGFFFWRRRRRSKTIGTSHPDMPPELEDKQREPGELDGQAMPPPELPGSGAPSRGKSVRHNGPPVELEA